MSSVIHVWSLLLLLHAAAAAVALTAGGWAGFLTLAAVHLAWVGLTLWTGSTPLGPARDSFPATGREVILTIDDGPCADTAAILDVLDRHQTKAVFFLIGSRAAASRERVQAIVARGHLIENHTLTHPSASFWAAGPRRLRREIGGCSDIIREITGRPPAWFRAPAGFRNPFTAPILRELNLKYLGWKARGFDTRITDPARVVGRLRHGFQPGAVLLVHQGHPHSVAVLDAVLTALNAEGFRAVLPPPEA